MPQSPQSSAAVVAAVEGFTLVSDLARPAVAHAQGQGAQHPIDVGTLSVCRGCEGLVIGGHCAPCARDRRDRATAGQVAMRPEGVVVPEPGETASPGPFVALHVPATATPLARSIAEVIAMEATIRLIRGDTLAYALNALAAGRDQVRGFLADRRGIHRDRKTVAAGQAELVQLKVLRKVGQLADWYDAQAPKGTTRYKLGAFVYALNVDLRQLGQTAANALQKHLAQGRATVRGTPGVGRVEKCLQAAIGLAMVGNRNPLGHWLICRCTDEALTEGEAMKVMESYRAKVPEKHSYSLVEMTATVRSRYRKLHRSRRAGLRGRGGTVAPWRTGC